MRWRPSQIFAAAFVVVGLAIIVIGLRPGSDGDRAGKERYQELATCIGEDGCLPDIELVDTTGEVFNRWSFEDRVVIINFWATSCEPCRREIPALADIYARYRARGLIVLGVMTDEVDDSALAAFRTANHLDYPVVRGNEALFAAFDHPRSVPTTFLFAENGDRFFHHEGEIDIAALDRVLVRLLGEVPLAEQPLADF